MKNRLISPNQLIVSADFRPKGPSSNSNHLHAMMSVWRLCQKLQGTGVCIKVNSALRAVGYKLIQLIHDHGLQCFADLKLFDIPETMETDAALLQDMKPEMLTVVCSSGIASIQPLKAILPNTKILGVTVLTTQTETEVKELYRATLEASIMKLSLLGEAAGVDGFISPVKGIAWIQSVVKRPMVFACPAIRSKWSTVSNDDQNPELIMSPAEAIKRKADYIIVGRPILNSADPRDAVMRILDEIETAN